MLREERATSVSYDPENDQLRIGIADHGAQNFGQMELNLLVDAGGHLVGIDLGGEGPGRWIVMLGRHEDVAEQRAARGEVAFQSSGAPAVVLIHGARAAVRAGEQNPYL